MNPHDYRPESAPGLGRWHRCETCGTTKHSGYYWHGGFKSKVEPASCLPWTSDPDWRAQAMPITHEDE